MAKFQWFANISAATVSGFIVFLVTGSGLGWWWLNENSDAPCHVTYHLMGALTEAKTKVRSDELDGATIYFLDTKNWPWGNTLDSISLTGGGVLAQGDFRGGRTVVTFPRGSFQTTPMLVRSGSRYWAIHDRAALHTLDIDNAPRHEFQCRGGRVREL
jgi:hypothetical protein